MRHAIPIPVLTLASIAAVILGICLDAHADDGTRLLATIGERGVLAIDIDDDGRTLAVAVDGTIDVIDLDDGERVRLEPLIEWWIDPDRRRPVHDLALLPDGGLAIHDGLEFVFASPTGGTDLRPYLYHQDPEFPGPPVFIEHDDSLWASWGTDNAMLLGIDPDTGRFERTLWFTGEVDIHTTPLIRTFVGAQPIVCDGSAYWMISGREVVGLMKTSLSTAARGVRFETRPGPDDDDLDDGIGFCANDTPVFWLAGGEQTWLGVVDPEALAVAWTPMAYAPDALKDLPPPDGTASHTFGAHDGSLSRIEVHLRDGRPEVEVQVEVVLDRDLVDARCVDTTDGPVCVLLKRAGDESHEVLLWAKERALPALPEPELERWTPRHAEPLQPYSRRADDDDSGEGGDCDSQRAEGLTEAIARWCDRFEIDRCDQIRFELRTCRRCFTWDWGDGEHGDDCDEPREFTARELSGEAPLAWPVDDGPGCDMLTVQKQKAQWYVTGYTEDSCD